MGLASQGQELTDLRTQFDWIAAVSVTCQEQALRDLDQAYLNFFSGRSGYPSPRRKGVNDSFRFKGRETSTRKLNAKWGSIRVPKIGWVKFRDTRPIVGEVRNVTIARAADGWYASIACQLDHEAPVSVAPHVGIDRGIANTISLSTGEHYSVPASLIAMDRRKRAAQRVLSGRKRGSRRYAKARDRVAAASARVADARKDWQHRISLDIARRFGVAAIEDLKIKNMTASGRGKRGLNRSILNQGWGAFATMLTYKMEERGGTVVKVPAAYTSQTCSECGVIDRESRESQASFHCRHCGHVAHADVNAAIEILRRSTAWLRVEEAGYGPVEARTEGVSDHAENPMASAVGGC
jgi:putative transposase